MSDAPSLIARFKSTPIHATLEILIPVFASASGCSSMPDLLLLLGDGSKGRPCGRRDSEINVSCLALDLPQVAGSNMAYHKAQTTFRVSQALHPFFFFRRRREKFMTHASGEPHLVSFSGTCLCFVFLFFSSRRLIVTARLSWCKRKALTPVWEYAADKKISATTPCSVLTTSWGHDGETIKSLPIVKLWSSPSQERWRTIRGMMAASDVSRSLYLLVAPVRLVAWSQVCVGTILLLCKRFSMLESASQPSELTGYAHARSWG